MHLKTRILLFGCCFFMLNAHSQTDFRRDSIHTDRGISNTLDFEPQNRIYFQNYQPNGRPGEILTVRMDEMGEWRPARRRLFTYDGDQVMELLTQVRSADDQAWLNERRRTDAYGGNGQLLSRTVEIAPEPGEALQPRSRRVYDYHGNGEVETITFERWETDAWQPAFLQQFSYTPAGEIEERLLQEWVTNAYEFRKRRRWTYGPNGFNPEQVLTQTWDAVAADWVNESRRQMTYNAAGFWIGSVDQVWNEDTQAWENLQRELHPFSGQGQLESYLYQFWDEEEWVNGVRETAFRSGLQFGSVVEQWDTLAAVWERQFRYRTTLNSDGLVAETVDRQYWESNMEEWINLSDTQRRTHFWSEVMVGLSETLAAARSCRVPNPYRPGMTFSCPDLPLGKSYSVELMDTAGRLVWQGRIDGGGALQLNGNIPPGTYILRIGDGAVVHHLQKLILID